MKELNENLQTIKDNINNNIDNPEILFEMNKTYRRLLDEKNDLLALEIEYEIINPSYS